MALERKFYFKEPLLEMPFVSRKTVSVIITIWTVILVVAAVTLIISSTNELVWPGIFIAIYLAHRALHLNTAEKSLTLLPVQGEINTAKYLNRPARNALIVAANRAMFFGGSFLLYLAKDLVDSREAKEALIRLDVNEEEFKSKLEEHLRNSQSEKRNTHEEILGVAEAITMNAVKLCLPTGSRDIRPADLLAALVGHKDDRITRTFGLFDINANDLEKALIFGRFRHMAFLQRIPTSLGGFVSQPYRLRHRIMNRAWTARPTPTLDGFSIDLTDMARAGGTGLLVGHEKEYDRMLDILSRPNKPNALLIGEAGAGKEAIVGHLAYDIINDKVPAPLFDKRLVALDLSSLLAGADIGEQQGRIKKIFEEINRAGNVILYLPDIHNLSRTAGRYELNVVNTIIPLILSNDFPTVGSTYPKEFKQFIENQGAFTDAFQYINIQEISEAEAERLLTYDSLILERQYKVKITYGAIKKSVEIAKKYFHQRLLPSSADDLLKEALAEAAHKGDKVLSADEVITIAERRTNIPLREAGDHEREKLLNLEKIIHERLINQEAAVSAVSRILREYRSGLTRSNGPIGAFLFVGPTGVGKTELSKILAEIQFGSMDAMVRFDMSEYQDKSSFYRFIGSPDGEVPGSLTEAVLRRPYSLVLLDEFEKAHPDVLNLFLQVFDDGRLTDNLGRVVDFKNTIIIATSNAESEFIKESIDEGKTMSAITEELKKKLVHSFRPELLNRMQIVVFKRLSEEDVRGVSRLLIEELKRTLSEKDIKLEVDDAVLNKIAELGYSPAYGGRPLRAVISEKIKAPLSEMILREEVLKGESVKISLVEDRFKIESHV